MGEGLVSIQRLNGGLKRWWHARNRCKEGGAICNFNGEPDSESAMNTTIGFLVVDVISGQKLILIVEYVENKT